MGAQPIMKSLSAKYIGILIGIIMVSLCLYLFYTMHLPPNGRNQYFIPAIFTGGIIWGLLSFHNKVNGPAAFKEYFSEGFKIFVVVTLIMALYTFIFYKLNPQILEDTLVTNNELIIKEGNHTPGEIETNSNKLRSIFMPMMLTVNTLKYLLLGTLVTAITAGFLSQKKTGTF